MRKLHSLAKPRVSRSNASPTKRTNLSCEDLEPRMMLSTVDVFAAGTTGEETLEVRLFDEVIATFENVGGDANAGVFEQLSFEVDLGGSVGGIDDLFFAFTNDLFIPGEVDRNLRIDAIVLGEFQGDPPVRFETEDPNVYSTGTYLPEDGVVRGFRESEFLHTNGFFNFSSEQEGGTQILIEARGNEGGEQFELQIDGQTVETFTVTQNTQTFEWQAPADQRVDYDQVRIVFTNDLFDPANGIDRNLIIEDVVVGRFSNSEFGIQPNFSRTVFSTGSFRNEDGIVPGIRYSDTLHANGYFQFGVFDVPSPGLFTTASPVFTESLSENAGAFEFAISRQGAADGEVSIDFATIAGSADASDFTPVSGTAVFADGVETVNVTVPIINDSVEEGDETFDFVIFNPTGGAVLNGPGVVSRVIVNDDISGVPFSENFDSFDDAGFTFNPFGTDTAARGQFEIGFPSATSNSTGPFQLGGQRALVTGLSAGTGIGSFDVDGGVTSALSPEIFLPAGTINELNFSFNFAHTGSATANDQFRIGVLVDGELFNVFQESGSGSTRNGEFIDFTVGLEDFAGDTIQLLFEAEDDSNTIIEAAVRSIVVETVS